MLNSVDKSISSVFETRNYAKFKLMNANRDVKQVNIERLKQSISQGYVLNPIIVNENLEICDGQHRFEALKQLDMPIHYFVVNGIGIKECQVLNAINKNWTSKDYIKSYADSGYKSYQLIIEFMNEYPFFADIHTILYSLQNSKANASGSILNDVKYGRFQVTTEMYLKACDTAEKIKDIGNYSDLYMHNLLQKAMMSVIWHEKYNHERMLAKLEYLASSKLKKCGYVADYYKALSEIYNYKSRNNDVIYFEIEFKN